MHMKVSSSPLTPSNWLDGFSDITSKQNCGCPCPLIYTHIHTRTAKKHTHTPSVTYGLPVLSTAAWGNGARLSLSPTSQLNIEPEGKCSTHWDNHDHTQSSWKVVYRQDSLDFRLRGRCNVTYLVCATGTSCLLSHTRANTDEHWQTHVYATTCTHADTCSKYPKQILSSVMY